MMSANSSTIGVTSAIEMIACNPLPPNPYTDKIPVTAAENKKLQIFCRISNPSSA